MVFGAMPVSRHGLAAALVLLTCACDPASAAGAAEPTTATTNDTIEARRVARECVLECDEQHERGTAAHLGCARRCLKARRGLEREVASEESAQGSTSWAFVFALSVSAALTLLATML
jgi:hypothetical protein